MAVGPEANNQPDIFAERDVEKMEGQAIEALKANAQQVIPDPVQWMDNKNEGGRTADDRR